MSILVKEDYANPEIPLWAKNSGGGGGAIPILLNSMTSENIYYLEDVEGQITVLGASINQPVSGNVLVSVNMNIYGNGGNQNYVIPISITVDDSEYYFTDLPRASAYANTSYSFNIIIPYVANDTDEYAYNFQVQTGTDITIRTSCSFVFYPNP